jgi:nucleotide sugar dehydrogenase
MAKLKNQGENLRTTFQRTFELSSMKVAVIGLGQIGLPVAQYIRAKNLEVWGYDISPNVVKRVSKTEEIKVTDSWNDLPQVDVYVVCVTTSQKDDSPDLSPVFDVCKQISQRAIASSLVCIESTIIPGTCKKIFESLFRERINLVHVPHRYWASDPDKHGVNQLRVIGAVNPESLKLGLKFYKDRLGIPLHVVSSAEVAEMCKITENAHRYLQIAFAEELKMNCTEIGLDFDELREACNTKWNVDMPEPRTGIGGHCLPKDIKYVLSLARSEILESALTVDKKYRGWLTKQA